jgi:hypothetical protein
MMYRITRYTSNGITTTSAPLQVIAYVDIERPALERIWKLITGNDLSGSAVSHVARGSRRVERMANGDTLILEKL